jgi:hypothetical protein
MLHQVVEAIAHLAAVGPAKVRTVPFDVQIQCDATVVPAFAQLRPAGLRRRLPWRQGRLGSDPAEAGFHLGTLPAAQRPVVDLYQQLDVLQRIGLRGCPAARRIGHDGELTFDQSMPWDPSGSGTGIEGAQKPV